MATKKDLIIVALSTFCLTSTLFIVLPSRSIEKDPWADVYGPDGVLDDKVNMMDIAYEIAHFNENVSNMTRDVNVTNWPTQQPEPSYRVDFYPAVNATLTDNSGVGNAYFHASGITGGYSKMSVQLDVYEAMPESEDEVNIEHLQCWWMNDLSLRHHSNAAMRPAWYEDYSISGPFFNMNWNQTFRVMTPTFETKGLYYTITFKLNSTCTSGWMLADITVCLTSE